MNEQSRVEKITQFKEAKSFTLLVNLDKKIVFKKVSAVIGGKSLEPKTVKINQDLK